MLSWPLKFDPMNDALNMNKKQLVLVVLLLLKKVLLFLKLRQHRSRRYWVHPVNQRLKSHRVYGHLVHEIREFSSYHCRYLRMMVKNFNQILALITQQDTIMRKAIRHIVGHVLFCQASAHVHEISQSDGYKERTIKMEVDT